MKIKQENERTSYHYSIKDPEDVNTMVFFTYEGDLQDFLKINYLATELSFINHKLGKVKQAITELKPIILFGDEPYYDERMEAIGKEGAKTKEEIRQLYWWSVRYESFLNDRLQELNQAQQVNPEPIDLTKTPTVEIITKVFKEQFGEIFANNGFKLFEHILSQYIKPKGKRGRQSDLIFYYWKMYDSETQYIHQRPTKFFEWFDKTYSETSGQLKTYSDVKTDQREKDYSRALDWFKENK